MIMINFGGTNESVVTCEAFLLSKVQEVLRDEIVAVYWKREA
jgi:hypothetical protein